MRKSLSLAILVYSIALGFGYCWLHFIPWESVGGSLVWLRVLAGPVPLLGDSGFGFFAIFSMVAMVPLLLFVEVPLARVPASLCFLALWLIAGIYIGT